MDWSYTRAKRPKLRMFALSCSLNVWSFLKKRFLRPSPQPMIYLEKALEQLRSRKELVDHAIAQLEGLLHGAGAEGPQSRRGRKSMGEAERRQVSSRMKSYWESRRKQSSQKSTGL
jgi:hypothetical protein